MMEAILSRCIDNRTNLSWRELSETRLPMKMRATIDVEFEADPGQSQHILEVALTRGLDGLRHGDRSWRSGGGTYQNKTAVCESERRPKSGYVSVLFFHQTTDIFVPDLCHDTPRVPNSYLPRSCRLPLTGTGKIHRKHGVLLP